MAIENIKLQLSPNVSDEWESNSKVELWVTLQMVLQMVYCCLCQMAGKLVPSPSVNWWSVWSQCMFETLNRKDFKEDCRGFVSDLCMIISMCVRLSLMDGYFMSCLFVCFVMSHGAVFSYECHIIKPSYWLSRCTMKLNNFSAFIVYWMEFDMTKWSCSWNNGHNCS